VTFSCSGARAGWDIDRACSPQITDDVGLQLFVPAPVHIFIFLSDYAPDSFLAHSTYSVHVPVPTLSVTSSALSITGLIRYRGPVNGQSRKLKLHRRWGPGA